MDELTCIHRSMISELIKYPLLQKGKTRFVKYKLICFGIKLKNGNKLILKL